MTTPSELEKLNTTAQSTDFKDDRGHMIAEVVLAVRGATSPMR